MRTPHGFVLTAKIKTAWDEALNALERCDAEHYFKQLAILYEAYESRSDGIKKRNISFELFMEELAKNDQARVNQLTKTAIEFYQSINFEFRAFTETAARLRFSLGQRQADTSDPDSELIQFYFLLPTPNPSLPIQELSTIYPTLDLNIGRVLLAKRTSRLLLQSQNYPARNLQVRFIQAELVKAALNAFDFQAPSSLLTERLLCFSQQSWQACIAALNTENINAFYLALADLAKKAAAYLLASGKDTGGESLTKFFRILHQSLSLDKKSFSKILNPKAQALYDELYEYHLHFAEQAVMAECSNSEERIILNNKMAAGCFCRALFPEDHKLKTKCKARSDKLPTEIEDAIQIAFYNPYGLRKEDRTRLCHYEEALQQKQRQLIEMERKIQSAQNAFLLALATALNDPAWNEEGKRLQYFFLPCLASSHKTPEGIARLRALLDKQSPSSSGLFGAAETILKQKIRKKNLWRSQKTSEFYTLWHQNVAKAKRGEFAQQLVS